MTDPGDDSEVLKLEIRLLPRGESSFGYEGAGHVAQFVRDKDGAWRLLLSIDRPNGRKCYALHVVPDASPRRASSGEFVWQVTRRAGGIVVVSPSVHVPGDLHAVVTLVDATSAPPWGA